jgi:hypothetical protein
VLGRATGTDVHLLTVEAWDERVVVRMAGAVNDAIRTELAGYEARMAGWDERRRAGSDEWPPKMPGELIFHDLSGPARGRPRHGFQVELGQCRWQWHRDALRMELRAGDAGRGLSADRHHHQYRRYGVLVHGRVVSSRRKFRR